MGSCLSKQPTANEAHTQQHGGTTTKQQRTTTQNGPTSPQTHTNLLQVPSTPNNQTHGAGSTTMATLGGASPSTIRQNHIPSFQVNSPQRNDQNVGGDGVGEDGGVVQPGDAKQTAATPGGNNGLKVSKIQSRYIIKHKLGAGSFGEVFLGFDSTRKRQVAIKLEPRHAKSQQLLREASLLKSLENGSNYVPRVFFVGVEGPYNVMVMDLLGSNLEVLFEKCQKRFSLKTVLMISDQLIKQVEWLHTRSFIIHRDLKPTNFLMGVGKRSHVVHLIDFGLSKKYYIGDSSKKQHIPYRENKRLTGTARYASIHTHRGIEQSRRDDMETLGYIFIYFLKGTLPWQGVHAKTKTERYQKIGEKKSCTPIEKLCESLPEEFSNYVKTSRNLEFEEEPDYVSMRKQFRELFNRKQYVMDYMFDWVVLSKSNGEKSGSPVSR